MLRFSLISFLLLTLVLAAPAWAADITATLPAGDGFVIQDNTGTTERLRVDEATGNISRHGALFIHTTGTDNTFVGESAGNTSTARRGSLQIETRRSTLFSWNSTRKSSRSDTP